MHEGPDQSLRSCSNTGSFFIGAPFQSFTSFLIVCYATMYVSSKGAKLLAKKVDIACVAQLPGRASLKTTQRYLKDLKRMHSLYQPREWDTT